MQTRDDFQPSRNEKCFCDSGLRFKKCCGSNAPDRPSPHGIVVIENFLSAERCAELVAIANRSPHEPLTTVSLEDSTAEEIVRKPHEGRVTDLVDLGDEQAQLDNLIENTFTQTIGPAIGGEFSWFERPQLLRYSTGSFYLTHSDSENYILEMEKWRKDLDRDISVLVYLSDEFEGGSIFFENFGYRVKPKAGMLVYFPSDSRYLHTAEEVTAGLRYAIVSWAALKGVERVRNSPPDVAIALG